MPEEKTEGQKPEEIIKKWQELENKYNISIKLYTDLKTLKQELSAYESALFSGNMSKTWELRSISKEDAWLEKSAREVKVIYKFKHTNTYDQYFAIYEENIDKLPTVEIKRGNETIFKTEINERKISDKVNLIAYNPNDDWHTTLLNVFYMFGTEVHSRSKQIGAFKKQPKENTEKTTKNKFNILGAFNKPENRFMHKRNDSTDKNKE